MVQAALTNLIDPPPRLTGDAGQDTVAVIQWLNAFYVKGVLSGALLQPQNMAPALISLGALPGAADMLAYYTAEDVFDLTGFTAFSRTLLDDADAASARTTLGAGTVTGVTGTAPIVSSGGDAPAISISDFVASGLTHARGAVPDPGAVAGTTRFLREDATFAVPPGAGDVVGPAGATGNNVVLFDGATGKLVKDGGTLGSAAYTASGAYDAAGAAAAAQSASQPVDSQLSSIAALVDAAGWLHNSGAGVFVYSTPTAGDVGAQPADADLTTWAGITPGANVGTALAVAVGTDGAFVVKGGALGTPSSAGTMPAFTLGGTVSGGGQKINNVIIGDSTPLAGTFTTLTATGLADLSGAGAGQIKFPAAQNASADANTLDDYEEGTWTPVYFGTGGSAGAYAVGGAYGYYTKVGRKVTATFYLGLTNKGSWTGNALIGMPNLGSCIEASVFGVCTVNAVTGYTAVSSYTYPGLMGAYLALYMTPDAGNSVVGCAAVTNTSVFAGTITYMV